MGSTDAHTRTVSSLQTVAEHLLAADLHHHTSKVGLRITPGGFGQPEFTANGERRRLRVDGTSLVVLSGDIETWTPVTTLAEAAAATGAALGAPQDVFTASTPFDPDAPLEVDESATRGVADWFALVGRALEDLRRANPGRHPAIAQLWPEHFDLAFNMAEVNFGGSPGDSANPEPYLYVGPWTPRQGEFWNESFGASLPRSEVHSPGDALAFFTEGLQAAET